MWQILFFALFISVNANGIPRITCNAVTPNNALDENAVAGNWVAVESVAFNNGIPYNPDKPEEDPRSQTCIHDTVSKGANGFDVKMGINLPGKDRIYDNIKLTKIGSESGRLSMTSQLSDRTNWEFIVLDGVADKYFVYALCQPPNAAGERLPYRVNFMSRHVDKADSEVLTDAERETLEKSIAEKFGVKGYGLKPVKYAKSCWTSYPEA